MLTPGDIALNFVLPDQGGHNLMLYGRRVAGSPVALAFCTGGENAVPLRGTLAHASKELSKAGIKLILVNQESSTTNAVLAAKDNIDFPVVSDLDGRLTSAYGIAIAANLKVSIVEVPTPQPTIYLLNLNFKVICSLRFDSKAGDTTMLGGQLARDIIESIAKAIPPMEPHEVVGHPPVLIIPDVFEPAFCKRLIDLWKSGGNAQSGFMRKIGDEGVEMFDDTIKMRRDHHIQDAEILREIDARFARRVVPEISKCFNFNITNLEGIKIGCYEAEKLGHFSAHRDNTTPITANRRFAVTLNLNTDEYDGGHLWFPEYGPYLYRPSVGGAVIFSCSLLHEAKPTTKGRRFVFVTFMYGEEDMRKHRVHLKSIGRTA